MVKDLLTTMLPAIFGLALVFSSGCNNDASRYSKFGDMGERRISIADYTDKMKAGWIGQMAGVGLGGPTEFRYKGWIIPEDKMPRWQPEMINQFEQDDIYVEMTFLRTLEIYGFDCSIRQAETDFANSGLHTGFPVVCISVLPERLFPYRFRRKPRRTSRLRTGRRTNRHRNS